MSSSRLAGFFNWTSFMTLFSLWVAWKIIVVVQRLFFHPLASFPGPMSAGASTIYRIYYSIWKDGEMHSQIRRLHIKYGPIVRVSPNELHFSNPEVYHTLYATGTKLVKDLDFYRMFAQENAIFGIIPPSVHKRRRDLLGPVFSRRTILKIEPLMQSKIDMLCTQLWQRNYKGKSSNLCLGYASMAVDIINGFCYGKCSEGLETLSDDTFQSPLVMSTRSSINRTIWIYRNFPWIRKIVVKLPKGLAKIITPSNTWTIVLMESLESIIDKILCDPASCKTSLYPTIFGKLLNPDASKGQVIPSKEALIQEAMGFIMAGSIEITNALTYGTFYVLNDPKIHQSLIEELIAIWPDPNQSVGYEILESLPYLAGIVKESLRLTHGAVTGLPRVVSTGGMELDGVWIPGGTIVSISATYLHLDKSIYPKSHEFRPERWMEVQNRTNLNRRFVPFSRGSRQCIGITMAYMELSMTLANIFRRFEMIVQDTRPEDFKWKEYFGPVFVGRPLHALFKPRAGYKGTHSEFR